MDSAVKQVLEKSGFLKINPVQEEALKAGVLEGENLVLAAPTASGKTLVAEFAALNAIRKGTKVVYIVPLRALASEKYHEFKEKYEKLGIKIALSIGDLDASDPWLSRFDLIIVTSEKFDSLLRHGIPWIDQIGLVVADEIHLLNDPGRGPTLEVTITKLKTLINPQILALSATIKNYEEIAEWLGAKAVRSDYRPVKLYRGVCSERKIHYQPEKKVKEIGSEHPPSFEIAKDTLRKKKQALVFVSTRRNTEALAGNLGRIVKDRLETSEKTKLRKISGSVLKSIEQPTLQCEKLSNQVLDGVAFHHAGLTNKQRKTIEDGFKEGTIKVIAATPTLAWGVNLPAYRVVVRDLKRFSRGYGTDYIPVLEIQQMMGRAGRPKYDREGEAILIARSKGEAEYVYDTYIKGEPENIQSKIGVAPVLRMHTLALIASGITPSKEKLFEFFSKTLYAHQYGDLSTLKSKIEEVIEMLKDFGFVRGSETSDSDNPFRSAGDLAKDEKLEATLIGKRVSELYIDPVTANYLITNLGTAKDFIDPFGLLQLVSNTLEMQPSLSLRRKDFEKINEAIAEKEKLLLEKPPNPWDIEYDDYLRSVKTAWFFSEWMEEMGEDLILEKFGVTPGELHVRLSNADWLLYATQELALLMGMKPLLKHIRKTRLRVKYGIREELLPLVRLKGIGRVRARILHSSNLRKLSDLRKVPLQSLSRLIGPKLARSVKDQLNELKESA
ncbi:MAG: DEAD/DEAH box helicase [Candidatus Aenigmatarchaeota archaeon]|nr:MAG: DEAD/DEAH box helicase [Candidatus Aenigmarchaeota archaeon]